MKFLPARTSAEQSRNAPLCPLWRYLGTGTESIMRYAKRLHSCLAVGILCIVAWNSRLLAQSQTSGYTYMGAANGPGANVQPTGMGPNAVAAVKYFAAHRPSDVQSAMTQAGLAGGINAPAAQQEAAVQAAMKYQGQRGYQNDLAKGMPAAQALAKWGSLMFCDDPSAMIKAAAMAQETAPPPKQSVTPRVPESGEGTMVAGTGFYVTDDGYLVTCAHVVQGATSFHVKSPGGSIPAKLIKKDRTIDVALLKVDGAFRALAVTAEPHLKLGDAVFTIGFPNPDVQGVEPKLTRGEISSLAGIQDNPRYFQISVPVQPGNSGGALVDEYGNVVGVITSRLDDAKTWEISGSLPQNVNYAVKGSLVRNFLNTVPELSGKLKAPAARDRENASAAAERAAVLVIAE